MQSEVECDGRPLYTVVRTTEILARGVGRKKLEVMESQEAKNDVGFLGTAWRLRLSAIPSRYLFAVSAPQELPVGPVPSTDSTPPRNEKGTPTAQRAQRAQPPALKKVVDRDGRDLQRNNNQWNLPRSTPVRTQGSPNIPIACDVGIKERLSYRTTTMLSRSSVWQSIRPCVTKQLEIRSGTAKCSRGSGK
jgi:hypothetical protein